MRDGNEAGGFLILGHGGIMEAWESFRILPRKSERLAEGLSEWERGARLHEGSR